MSQWWPLFQLRLQTPALELRLPSDSDLDALASLIREQPARTVRLRLDRQTWVSTRAVPVTIAGLEPCLPLFGLAAGRCDAG